MKQKAHHCPHLPPLPGNLLNACKIDLSMVASFEVNSASTQAFSDVLPVFLGSDEEARSAWSHRSACKLGQVKSTERDPKSSTVPVSGTAQSPSEIGPLDALCLHGFLSSRRNMESRAPHFLSMYDAILRPAVARVLFQSFVNVHDQALGIDG
jgi:hypothetical protein